MNVGYVVGHDPEHRDIKVLLSESDSFEVILFSEEQIRKHTFRIHESVEFLVIDSRSADLPLEKLVDTIEQTQGALPFSVVVADVQDLAVSIQHRLFEKGCISFISETELSSPAHITNLFARVRGVRKLAESAKRFRMMVEHTQELITLTDSLGLVQYENPAIQSILGYSQNELLGKLAFDLIHEADRPTVLQQYVEELATPSNGRSLKYRFRHASGEWRYLDSLAKQVPLEDDKIGFIISS